MSTLNRNISVLLTRNKGNCNVEVCGNSADLADWLDIARASLDMAFQSTGIGMEYIYAILTACQINHHGMDKDRFLKHLFTLLIRDDGVDRYGCLEYATPDDK